MAEDKDDKELAAWLGRDPEPPLVNGMRQAPDGKWYIPDPKRPGKWLQVQEG